MFFADRFVMNSLKRFSSTAVAALLLSSFSQTAVATTYTVTNTADTNDGTCDAADCTLREALTAANASTATPHTIVFSIPAAECSDTTCTISPTSQLPKLTRGEITIDGTTQSGFVANTADFPSALNGTLAVVLNGSGAGTSSYGLYVNSANNVVKGLVIRDFRASGILITGSTATGNKVQGCYVGTDVTGESRAGNAGTGGVYLASASNVFGTDGDGLNDAAERNLVSGNTGHGIAVSGSSNKIAGNFIGTDKDGDTDLGNTGYGLTVGGDSNTFGTNADGIYDAAEGNLVSGNDSSGFYLGSSADDNVITASRIGTNAAGTAALANAQTGIYNAGNRTLIGAHASGATAANEGNVISGNTKNGIQVNNGGNVVIAGNRIGTDATGLTSIGNGQSGVVLFKANNRIGTDGNGVNDETEGNVISGNGYMGVYISGSTATGNTVAGNNIGVGSDDTTDLGNASYGVGIYSASTGNVIGGDTASEGNVIAYNGDAGSEYGVSVGTSTSSGNRIIRNSFFQNQSDGIKLASGSNGSQTAPVIVSESGSTSLTLSGTAKNTGDLIQIFDASTDSEGQTYVGETSADASQNWSLTVDAAYSTLGNILVATATDPSNNTSAFSSTYTITSDLSASVPETTNNTPVAADGSASTAEDTALSITLSATDADGDALTYAVATPPSHGTLSDLGSGNMTYAPNADYNGADSFTFTATDPSAAVSNAATVSITVTAVNDAPVISSPATTSVNEDESVSVTLAGTDVDGDTLTYTVTTQPANGTASSPGSGNATTYAPTADYNGADAFAYQISDGSLTANSTVSVTVNPINDTPIAGDLTVYAGTSFTANFTLSATDVDAGDTLTYSYVAVSGLSGAAPSLSYAPTGIVRDTTTFEYTVADVAGASDTGTVTISPAADPIRIGAGGFLTRLYQDPSDPDSCWATSDVGGIFLSTDGCETFEPKNNSFWRDDHFSVDDVLVDSGDPDTVYAIGGTYALSSSYPGSLGCCLWKSTDRGENWAPLLRRNDGACNYYSSTATLGFVTTCTGGTSYLRQDGRKDEELYSSTFSSSDKYGKRALADGKRLAIDPSSCGNGACQTLYVTDFNKGIYKSLDGGENFSQLPLPAITSYLSNLRVSSVNLVPYTSGGSTQYLILVGARFHNPTSSKITSTSTYSDGALYLGFNGGESPTDWVTLTPSASSLTDIRDIAMNPNLDLGTIDANDVFHMATGKAGVVKGAFTAIDTVTPSASVTLSYSDNCGSGASGSYGSGLDFETTCDESIASGTYVAVEADPTDGNNLYATSLSQGEGQVYHSTDGGTNWAAIIGFDANNHIDDANFDYNGVWFNQHYWKIASFAATVTFVNRDAGGNESSGGDAVAFSDFWSTWKSPNDGSDLFSAYYQGIENVVFMDLAADPFDPKRFYLATLDHAFFTSEDGGQTTTLRGSGGSTPYPSSSGIEAGQGYGYSIAFSTTESAGGYADKVFLATNNNTTQGGKLYESSDGGETFTDIGATAGLPVGFVKAIAYDPANTRLYAALNTSSSVIDSSNTAGVDTDSGLYCLDKLTGSWMATQITAFTTALGETGSDVFSNEPEIAYHAATGKVFVMHNSNTAAYRKLFSYTPGTTCSNGSFSSALNTAVVESGTTLAKLQAVAVDPTDADKIYLGTYKQGLWYTADGGANWTRYYLDPDSTSATARSSSYYNRSVSKIAIHPADPNIVFVGGQANYYDESGGSYYGVKADVIAANKTYYDPGVVVYNASTGEYHDLSAAIAPYGRDVQALYVDANEPYRLLVGMTGEGAVVLHLDDIMDWSGTALER